MKLKGFLVEADAIVQCPVCDASEGVPCKDLQEGYVHFGRRLKRLLMTARYPEKRRVFERRAVKMLKEWLATQPN